MSQSGVLHQELPVACGIKTSVTREDSVFGSFVRLQKSFQITLKIALITIISPGYVMNPTLMTLEMILGFGLISTISANPRCIMSMLFKLMSV